MHKPITDTLRELNGGKFVEQASEALASLVRDCMATGKPGVLNLVLKVKPVKGSITQATIEQDYKLKSPAYDQPAQFFFVADGDTLVMENPLQKKLDLQDVRERRATEIERVDPETGEILRVPAPGAGPTSFPGQQQQAG